MRIGKTVFLCALCSTLVFPLFGCRPKDHILDGPGMVNDLTWKDFTLSRSDSNAQYCFWFTVEKTDNGFVLTGECRDDQGFNYLCQEGVELSGDDIRYLRSLYLGDLPDYVPAEEEELVSDNLSISLTLTYLDGQQGKKRCSPALSLELYEKFLPYFMNQ